MSRSPHVTRIPLPLEHTPQPMRFHGKTVFLAAMVGLVVGFFSGAILAIANLSGS